MYFGPRAVDVRPSAHPVWLGGAGGSALACTEAARLNLRQEEPRQQRDGTSVSWGSTTSATDDTLDENSKLK